MSISAAVSFYQLGRATCQESGLVRCRETWAEIYLNLLKLVQNKRIWQKRGRKKVAGRFDGVISGGCRDCRPDVGSPGPLARVFHVGKHYWVGFTEPAKGYGPANVACTAIWQMWEFHTPLSKWWSR